MILIVMKTAEQYQNHIIITESHHSGIIKEHLLQSSRRELEIELRSATSLDSPHQYVRETPNGSAKAECIIETSPIWSCNWELTTNNSGTKFSKTFHFTP
ncbi:hypothetical protein [Halobacillus litoralis]|uniref:hypothetical protein n=1 Tax=Halobacillus litoralis TaxID=45668 RepID=UPI001CFCFF5C|nr:hypothetical protein [Halobacillus litoralis]